MNRTLWISDRKEIAVFLGRHGHNDIEGCDHHFWNQSGGEEGGILTDQEVLTLLATICEKLPHDPDAVELRRKFLS